MPYLNRNFPWCTSRFIRNASKYRYSLALQSTSYSGIFPPHHCKSSCRCGPKLMIQVPHDIATLRSVSFQPEPLFPAYHEAFLTPGISPARALTRKLYCKDYHHISSIAPMYPREVVVEDHALSVSSSYVISAQRIPRTLVILKSLRTPLPFPPSMHRFRICVGRV